MLERGEVLDVDAHYFKILVPYYKDRMWMGTKTYVWEADFFDIASVFFFIVD